MVATSLSLINQAYFANGLSLTGNSKDATTSTNTDASTQAVSLASPAIKSGSTTPTSTLTSGKSALARQQLNKQQLALAKDLRAALTKSGAQLDGTVDFSVDANGKLSVSGSDADKAKVQAALAADKSTPSLSSRLASLDKQAESFDKQNMQAIAISTAVRMAGKSTQNIMATYQSLMNQQSASSAVFSLSDKTSQLAFNGAVDAKA